ncbi:MAG: hypothetical protein JNL99_01940 [Zoogloea sp.]|nr:hypothetical protein [Zoogloea sp.]
MSLEDLAGACAVVDAEATPSPADLQPAVVGPDPVQVLAAEVSGLIQILLALLSPPFPSLKAIYTPDVVEQLSRSIAAVCVKRQWLEGGFMGDYAEEMTLALIVLPLGVQTYHAVRADLALMKAKNVTPAGEEEAPKEGEGGA